MNYEESLPDGDKNCPSKRPDDQRQSVVTNGYGVVTDINVVVTDSLKIKEVAHDKKGGDQQPTEWWPKAGYVQFSYGNTVPTSTSVKIHD